MIFIRRFAIMSDDQQKYVAKFGTLPIYYFRSLDLPIDINEVELCDISKNILQPLLTYKNEIKGFDYWTNECREMNFPYCERIKLTKKALQFTFLDNKDQENFEERANKFAFDVFNMLKKKGVISVQKLKIKVM